MPSYNMFFKAAICQISATLFHSCPLHMHASCSDKALARQIISLALGYQTVSIILAGDTPQTCNKQDAIS